VSERDIAIVKALWDAWERRDAPAAFALYDEDIAWDMTRSNVPGIGVYRGHAGVRQFFEYWHSFWVRDGKVVRVVVHRDRDEAMAHRS
jgi:ketosteroid isomerase-like protein